MEGVLSQDEIDALLGGGSSDEEEVDNSSNGTVEHTIELTKEEKDAIGEVGNISLGSSSTALSTLIGKNVSIDTPKVEVMNINEFINKIAEPKEKVVVKIEYKKGFSGLNILIINKQDATIIGDLMMGEDGTNPKEFTDMYKSAVGEAMNQMMGSASTSLAGMFDMEIDIKSPEISVSSITDLEKNTDFFEQNDEFITIEFNLTIGDLIDTKIYQTMNMEFVKEITQMMFAQAEGEGAVEQQPKNNQQSQINQPQQQQQPQMQQPQMQQPQQQQQPQMMQQPQQQQQQQPQMMGQNQQLNNVNVQPAQFSSFGNQSVQQDLPSNIDMIMDIPLQVTVELGRTKMKIKEILDLGGGSIVELDRLAGEPVDIRVNGKMIAKGEVVVIDESFGVRITDIVSKMERINKVQ